MNKYISPIYRRYITLLKHIIFSRCFCEVNYATDKNAKAYIEGMGEHGNIDRVAMELGHDPQLFRQWVQLDREFIDHVNRFGSGEGSGDGVL